MRIGNIAEKGEFLDLNTLEFLQPGFNQKKYKNTQTQDSPSNSPTMLQWLYLRRGDDTKAEEAHNQVTLQKQVD